MAKRNTSFTQNKLTKYLKEGRGQGELDKYKPWLTVQDFPSMGRATRIFGSKTKRIHHFFSDTQLKYFYLLEFEKKVKDIREQYPLLHIEELDVSDINMNKFKDKKSDMQYVLTTTFLITLIDSSGKEIYAARSIKYASELCKKSTCEKLEIERRYWQSKGVDWAIVTNKDINTVRAKNIEWLHPVITGSPNSDVFNDDKEILMEGLLYRFRGNKKSVRKIIVEYEKDYSLDDGTGLLLFKHLIVNGQVTINLNKKINISNSGDSFCIEKGGFHEICS